MTDFDTTVMRQETETTESMSLVKAMNRAACDEIDQLKAERDRYEHELVASSPTLTNTPRASRTPDMIVSVFRGDYAELVSAAVGKEIAEEQRDEAESLVERLEQRIAEIDPTEARAKALDEAEALLRERARIIWDERADWDLSGEDACIECNDEIQVLANKIAALKGQTE